MVSKKDLKIGDMHYIKGVGPVELVDMSEDSLEYEEVDGSSTALSYEEFLGLISTTNKEVSAYEPAIPEEQLQTRSAHDELTHVDEQENIEIELDEGSFEKTPSSLTSTETHKGFAFDSLESVRKKLIDLTNRNNLLNYRHPKASCLRIIDELPDQIVEVLDSGKSFTFIPVPEPTEAELVREGYIEINPETREKTYLDDPTAEQWAKCKGLATAYDLPPKGTSEYSESRHQDTKLQTLMYAPVLEARCRSIRSKSETAIQESGANILYLVLGFLEWHEADQSDIVRQSPLFTLPVRMERKKFERGEGVFRYTISLKDDGLLTNIPLREKLANDFGLILPELQDDETPESYFERVSKVILRAKPTWRIRRQATLALLNFSKQVMYADLDPSRWPEKFAIQKHPIIKQFFSSSGVDYCQDDIGYTGEYQIDEVENIHELFPLVYEADSSQHSALIDAVKGTNLVIEGPPGSGKSQTITNLIAASIANGKRVLFVAEKMAALDVVKNRLDQVGLGDFCLELHSHKTQKLKILGELDRRVINQDSYRYPLDIDVDIERYEDLKEKLQIYANRINSQWRETGLSVHEILNKATRYREKLNINPDQYAIDGVNGHEFTRTKQRELFDQAELLTKIFDLASSQTTSGNIVDHYWYGVENTELFGYQADELFSSLKKWTEVLVNLSSLWEEHATHADLMVDLNAPVSNICEYVDQLSRLPDLIGDEPIACVPQLSDNIEQLEQFLIEYGNIHKETTELLNFVHRDALEVDSLRDKMKESIGQLNDLKVAAGVSLNDLAIDLSLSRDLIESARMIDDGLCRIAPKVSSTFNVALKVSPAGIKEFMTLVETIEHLPKELWRNRNQLYDDDDLDPFLDQLQALLYQAKPLHDKLLNVFSLHRLPSHKILSDLWEVYESGGLFKIFSSSWRKAKKGIVSLASNNKTNSKEVMLFVPELIEYSRILSDLTILNDRSPLIGELFRGVETDIEPIQSVRAWYKDVRKEYGQGFGDRVAIGEALFTLDRKTAFGLLDYAKHDLWPLLLKVQQGRIRLLEHFPEYGILKDESASLASEESAFVKIVIALEPSLEIFKKVVVPPDFKCGDLLSLHSRITTTQTVRKEWQDNPIKEILQKHSFELNDTPGTFSLELMELGDNFLEILRVINESPTLKNSICAKPDADRYRTLRFVETQFSQILSECNRAKNIFYKLGDICEEDWNASSDGLINSLIEKNEKALEKKDWLATWLDYIKVRRRMSERGLIEVIERLEDGQFSTREICDVLVLCVFHQLAKEIFANESYLANFSGLEQSAIQSKFREYDHKLQRLQQEKIAYRASRTNPPGGISSGKVSNYTEMSLIRQEMGKRKRHIAVRALMRRSGRAIQALKPCFMMSPMSVAQYLEPGRFEFDLVVMDEASQIRPEDALGAVARGKWLVVVGDPKQLPPTSFFQKILSIEDDEDVVALEESESILESVIPIFKNRRLRWHYRSRHESLIAFSNHHFYDSNLILFPSPERDSAELGVRFVRVKKGRFHNRRNVEEAKRIVADVAEQLIRRPEESVGIVAMNSEQRDEIEQQLDQYIKDNANLSFAMENNKNSKEPLIIKNLENVQGDERDVIYISMTYGPEQIGGRLMQRFGPINTDVGWRRLNVLFTRSKRRMIAYSSMGSGDIVTTAGSSRGVKALKNFLEYCESGHLHAPKFTGKSPDSDFEIAVMQMLEKYGYECEPQLGVAGFFLDLAVKDPGRPGRFLMGIECDGATYHSAKSARDRDRLRQEILEDLGWTISRVWSTDWFKNPEACLQPIIQQLDSLKTVISEPEVSVPEQIFKSEVELDEELEIVETQQLFDEEESVDLEMSLEDRLLEFNTNVIRTEQPDTDPDKRILRPVMLTSLLYHLPCSKGEFLELIPGHLRSGTDASEGKYVGLICDLIADYG